MRHEITMPQLGMTQDSGVIVSWGKKPGDTVKADDILMEVETDKSTMEVEVGRDGILAELRAEAGATVPVGDIIAVISDSADDVITAPAVAKAEKESQTASPQAQSAESEPGALAATPPPKKECIDANGESYAAKPAASAYSGRILSSPKAKLEAHRRGIDLARLARNGLQQPFHLADLEKLAPRPQSGGGTLSALAATVDREAFDAFCRWASEATEGAATAASIWAAFATASWRSGFGLAAGEPLTTRIETIVPIPSARTFFNADGTGLGEIVPLNDDADADLVGLDLIGSGLSNYRSGGSAVPTFTVAESGDDTLCITLGFDEADLPLARAAAVLAALAGRVKQPLRHLL